MKTLALETSAMGGSVAVLDHDQVLVEQVLDASQRTAQSLLPCIKAVLRQVDWRPWDLELIAVTTGPGSFTGLRAGVTTAKTLAYATGACVIGVNTLQAIAWQADVAGEVVALLDAQRRELFVARYQLELSGGRTIRDLVAVRIVPVDRLFEQISPDVTVTGPGLSLVATWPERYRLAPPSRHHPRAGSVGELGWRLHQAGVRHDVWTLLPQYHRASAAEEKAAIAAT